DSYSDTEPLVEVQLEPTSKRQKTAKSERVCSDLTNPTKRHRSAPPARDALAKRRQVVFQAVSKLKQEGKTEKRGVFAAVAEYLGLSPNTVRNDYKAAVKYLENNPQDSSMDCSDGGPMFKVSCQ